MEPTNHTHAGIYVLDPYQDRPRLVDQFEIMREEVMAGVDRALVCGKLSTDPATARWRWLDVGCGEGLFLRAVGQRYTATSGVGIDRDSEAIQTATAAFGRPGLLFIVHDVTQPLPAHLGSGTATVAGKGFNFVFANVVLMHIREVDRALTNLAASLLTGGIILTRDWYSTVLTFPHPSFQALFAVGIEALARTACPDYAANPSAHLTAAGFTDLIVSRYAYPIGGTTPTGQQMFKNLLAGWYALRSAAVDHLQIMGGSEYDNHLRRLQSNEVTPAMAGEIVLTTTIGRKR